MQKVSSISVRDFVFQVRVMCSLYTGMWIPVPGIWRFASLVSASHSGTPGKMYRREPTTVEIVLIWR